MSVRSINFFKYKIKEFALGTGEKYDIESLAQITARALDEDTIGRLEDFGADLDL